MPTVLICESDNKIRSDIKERLFQLGIEKILDATDGKSGIDLALASFPDLIIFDISTNGIDGISAASEIKKKLKVPIVLLSDKSDHETVKRATNAGIASFLTKPLRDDDLLPAMELAFAHTNEIEELKEKIEDLKETLENRKVIEKAKGVLMEKERLSEQDAYRKLQKVAMDKRKSLRQVADFILKGW